jgi:hypothetical protein
MFTRKSGQSKAMNWNARYPSHLSRVTGFFHDFTNQNAREVPVCCHITILPVCAWLALYQECGYICLPEERVLLGGTREWSEIFFCDTDTFRT